MYKNRVLCVDDLRDDCELFSTILADLGCIVESANTFADALQLIKIKTFDLYLFDVWMPAGSGLTLLKLVRMIDPSVPVILCTADNSDSVYQEAIQAGAQALLVKPVDFNLLIELVSQFLHHSQPVC